MRQLLGTVTQKVRYTLRGFRRRSLFAPTAILTLALAVGDNTAIFSMVSAGLLRARFLRQF